VACPGDYRRDHGLAHLGLIGQERRGEVEHRVQGGLDAVPVAQVAERDLICATPQLSPAWL
jgi:hypothetical protein